ncbi:MAG: HEAT repeat domain-containing protein, partial [Myxococcales bacterium]|nr:HEAT repeat domain-containing protein [Myxococcales bacterium]
MAAGPRRPGEHGADAASGEAGASKALARRDEPTTALATAEQSISALVSELLALDAGRQARAREALVGYGAAAVAQVGPLLYDQMPGTRRAAAETLGALGVPEAVTPLAELLADVDAPAGVQAVALHAIGQLLDHTEVPDFPRALVASCLGDPDPYVRAAAAATLMRIGGGARLEALEAVIDDDEEWVHVSGLAALAAVASPADQRLRDALLDGLVRIADIDALCLLLQAIGSVLAAPVPDDRVAFAPLTHFLAHDEPRVRQHAARALAALAPCLEEGAIDAQTLEPLVRVADTDPEVAREIVAVIAAGAERESPRATRALVRLLSAAEREVAQEAARALGRIGGRHAIDALVDMANADPRGRAGWTVVVAAQVLGTLDGSAAVTAARDEQGRWSRAVQLRCQRCEATPALVWRRVGAEAAAASAALGEGAAEIGREELRCPECDAEHVVGANEKALLVERAPFGVCRCCSRKRLLVRRGDTQVLICPSTERQHVRPFDHPRQVRLIDELPHGACECCAEPQPLIRLDDRVVCYRTRRHHMPTERGYALPQDRVADDVAAINDALLLGTLGIGQSGLPSVAGGGEEDEE